MGWSRVHAGRGNVPSVSSVLRRAAEPSGLASTGGVRKQSVAVPRSCIADVFVQFAVWLEPADGTVFDARRSITETDDRCAGTRDALCGGGGGFTD